MSMLPADITAELARLLQALQSSDNSIRSQSEEHLHNNWFVAKPEVLLMGLVEQISGSTDANARSFAALIFRRYATKSRKLDDGNTRDMFLTLSPEQSLVIRQKLLETLANETDRSARNKISDAVAELARQYAEEETAWTELLQVLFQLSIAPDAGKREVAFRIFSTTPKLIEKQHEDAVLTAFGRGFKDETVSVRIAAMEAFTAFFRTIPRKTQAKYFSLIGDILSILPPIHEGGDSGDLAQALLSLIDLAESSPKMFKPMFNNLVQFSVRVIRDKELSDVCRQNALELMATFADYAPSMCRKDPNYTEEMITQCLSLMTDLGEDDDDAAEWMAADDFDQEENDQNHVAGEQCMDRLANKLGGTVILAPTFNWLPRMMSSSAWRDRHAALQCISAISEGCRDLMIGELSQVLDLVVPALKDPHPRVRWAGCNALGQMSTDFATTMQKEYYDPVLKAIIPVLDSPEARVQSHAAAALVNFCEEAEKQVLAPYLDDLLSRLFSLLQNPKRYVQEQALSTIATIADAAEQNFGKYYDSLMPLLMGVLQRENDKEYRLLRAKAMECATLIALAVGKDRLGPDALALVRLLANIQSGITDDDDPQAQYLMHCWGRMCRVMGDEFLPFLPSVMPPLLELASAKADVQLLDDETEVEKIRQLEGWELVPVKGKMIGIKTSLMDDKHMAIELLVVYAQVLEGAFAPFAAEIMEKIALPGLAFFFHDPVRFVSAKLVPQLLNAFKKAYGAESTEMGQLWNATVTPLIEVLQAEPAIDALAEMYQCFYESVDIVGRPCLTQEHMRAYMDAVHSTLEDYKTRVTQREEERQTTTAEDAEDEADELLMAIEDDQTLLSDINKAFHIVFKYHRTDFLRAWELMLPTYEQFLKSPDTTQRQWGLCIMDDVLEFCGADSIHYAAHISSALTEGCKDPSPAIRQAAAYGIGVAAHHGGEGWANFMGGAIAVLLQSTQIPEARSEDNIYATENACAAVAKILHYNASAVQNVDAVIAQWIETLPVSNDEEAAPYAYAYLVELIEKRHPAVLAQASPVFLAVAAALDAETLTGQTATRVVNATKVLLTETGTNAAALLQNFTPEQQQTISAHFT